MVEEQEEELAVYADEGDMLDLKPLLNIQKCNFHPHFEPKLLHPQGNQQRMSPSCPTWSN